MEPDSAQRAAERYLRFARTEAPGRSAVYADWAQGAAGDEEVLAVLARIRPEHRQPPLVFAVCRMLGCGLDGFATFRRWLLEHADTVVAECEARSLQTNEPLRCAALLPALSRIDGPIALVEVGASAGLCLYPDRYAYRFACDDGEYAVDPSDGTGAVVLRARWHGVSPRLRMPQVVWRAGIDLHPRDARESADRAWLQTLVWPGEAGRLERIRAALDVAASDPPWLVTGDAVRMLPAVVDAAPRGATVVVTTPGVLVHIPRAGRERLVGLARRSRWVTLDAPGLHSAVRGSWHPAPTRQQWPDGMFALALDGRVIAAVDPLGAQIAPMGGRWGWRPDPGDAAA